MAEFAEDPSEPLLTFFCQASRHYGVTTRLTPSSTCNQGSVEGVEREHDRLVNR